MPEVPREETGTAALGVRRVGEEQFEFNFTSRTLRIVRGSPRPRRLLAWRYELVDYCGGSISGGERWLRDASLRSAERMRPLLQNPH